MQCPLVEKGLPPVPKLPRPGHPLLDGWCCRLLGGRFRTETWQLEDGLGSSWGPFQGVFVGFFTAFVLVSVGFFSIFSYFFGFCWWLVGHLLEALGKKGLDM